MLRIDLKIHWLVKIFTFAVLVRFILIFTQAGYYHPDEWFQTAEFANILSYEKMGATQEVGLHLRNLTWPSILAFFIKLFGYFSTQGVAKYYAIKGATLGFESLQLASVFFIIHCFFKILEQKQDETITRKLSLNLTQKKYAFLFLALFPALLNEATRPSQEHLSSCIWWIGLALAFDTQNKKRLFLAALFFTLTAAFRPASGLLGLGSFLALIWMHKLKAKQTYPVLLLGSASGFILGGLADFIFYGRPWESLYMYLQYNVFTGLSVQNFGHQSTVEYFYFLKGLFPNVFIPLGILFAGSALLFIYKNFKVKALLPIYAGFVLYLGAHLLIGHKEPRFMSPLLLSYSFFAVLGLFFIAWKPIQIIAALSLLLSIKTVWGEFLKSGSNFLELDSHLNNDICAVVSHRRPLYSTLSNQFTENMAYGYLSQRREGHILWINTPPQCADNQEVLFQPPRNFNYLNALAFCTPLSSGLLKFIPSQKWEWALEKNAVSSIWLKCKLNSIFETSEIRKTVVTTIPKFNTLPPLGINAQEFIEWAKKSTEGTEYSMAQDATLGDH